MGVDRIEGDLFDPETLIGTMKGVTAIIHLAAVFRAPDTYLIWKSNVDGTRNLIEAAKAHAPQVRFILASTSNIYDESGEHPGLEDDVVAPEHPYPASKLKAETLFGECGLPWSILRFSFVYGDGDRHLEALTNPWHLHVDNTNARRLGLEPSVRTVYQSIHDKLM